MDGATDVISYRNLRTYRERVRERIKLDKRLSQLPAAGHWAGAVIKKVNGAFGYGLFGQKLKKLKKGSMRSESDLGNMSPTSASIEIDVDGF